MTQVAGLEVRVLSGSDVRRLLPMAACIDLMQRTMIEVSDDRARIPLRSVLPVSAGNLMGLMPGYLAEPECFGLKVLSLFPDNPAAGFSSHLGLVLLFEPAHGRPVAILDGAEITAIRTAAVSGLATRLLARADAGDLAILGSGEQAQSHLAAMLAARSLRRVRVWSRSPEHAAAFAAREGERHGLAVETAPSVRDAVAGADLICTVTASATPVLLGEWLAPGMHVNAAGASRASSAEVDAEALMRSRYFVDYRASAANEAGEYLDAMKAGLVTPAHILGEIGEVAAGRVVGRRSDADITMFKSLGVAPEDLAAAHYILAAARAQGVGQTVTL